MAKYRSNYSKKPLIIAGAARLGVIALAAALVIAGVVGLSGKADGSDGIQVGVVGLSDNVSPQLTPTAQPPAANTSSSTGLAPVERASDESDPVNDPISTRALQGRWTSLGTTWVFGDNGRFAQMEFRSTSARQTDRFGDSGYRSTAATRRLIHGEYKVSGGVIKLTNCYISSSMAFSSDYFNNINANDALANLATTQMSDFSKIDGYTAEFEFIDASLLRVRLNNEFDKYDNDLTRADGPTTAPLPSHRIPPAKWPSGRLSPDMPEYTGDRIREVSSYDDGETALEYRYFWTTIDRTSSDEFLAYIEKLRVAGWAGQDNKMILDGINSVDPNSLLYSTYTTHFQKGCYNLIFTVTPGGNFKFEISSKRKIEGLWPSDAFGNEFKPPAGTVLIGETWVQERDGGFYSTIEMDFYPGTVSAYIKSLKINGFADGYWSNDYYKWMRINGRMYKVGIQSSGPDDDRFDDIMYSLSYYPNFAWPSDIPPGIIPPAGVELFGKYDDDPRPIMNDSGDFGMFSFYVLDMSEAEVEAYINKLEQNDGWDAGWGNTAKNIQWKGQNWYCTIGGGSSYEGLVEFEVSFMLSNN